MISIVTALCLGNRDCMVLLHVWLLVWLVHSFQCLFSSIQSNLGLHSRSAICFRLEAFLIGPKRQVTMMLDPVRIYATAIYLASIIIALFCALYVHNKLLTLLAIMLEFGALIWYSLSYIPFARTMVSKMMTACFDTEF
ncbi:hypothetical protein AQUCO_00800182v1 [Aquilegia coerulea]|uniref:Vesicle transport protein n=1 Tax=Aquilegia coerulea TaxID=218851 RepID=A0A2G5EHL9_AQUCA|nr:hypothetical protein AQUCO_00800182v1 [Aquilegia coerulea]